MTPTGAAAVDALVRRVATASEAGQDELAELILARLRETVPEFFADEDVAFDMGSAVRANVGRVHRLLAGGPAAARSDALPVEAGDLLQSTLQHGIPLISLLEAYRTAQGLATDWWQRRLERDAPPSALPAATRTLHERVVAYIDVASAQIREAYELERRALESSADGRRAHLVRKLLAGEPLDAEAASRTLNHPLAGRHVALVLWRTGRDAPPEALEHTLARIAEAVPARVLTTSARHRVYAWLSSHGELDASPALGVPVPAGVRVAMSGAHRGIEGFVRAHEEATRTAALVRDGAGPASGESRIAVFERFELVGLLARDPDDCRRFVARVLGPLAAGTPRAALARETLQAYLAAGSSTAGAARALGVHRNTVAYRLQALTGLLDGLEGPDAEWADRSARRLELELALHVTAQLGPPDAPG